MDHGLIYGDGVFEGIRATTKGYSVLTHLALYGSGKDRLAVKRSEMAEVIKGDAPAEPT